ncbi:MAG: LysE family translocator [Opitutales bacterium]
MTLAACLALIATLTLLAAIPSASVMLVVTRTATHGTRQGLAVAAGIAAGDLIFVALALTGMTLLAETLGGLFFAVRILAGLWLIFLGIQCIRAAWQQKPTTEKSVPSPASSGASFLAGLLLTLGDAKAILFYASLFPAFFDLSQMTPAQAWIIGTVTVLTVGAVKAAYALLGQRLTRLAPNRSLRTAAGTGLCLAGGWLIARP